MKLIDLLHIENPKIQKARFLCMVLCMILGLLSAMILSFYHSTEVLEHFYLGYTFLRLSAIWFAFTLCVSTGFDKIRK